MKAFIDTNVLLDNLAMREGFYEGSKNLIFQFSLLLNL